MATGYRKPYKEVGFFSRNKTFIVLFILFAIGLFALNNTKNTYHKREVKILTEQIESKERDFLKVLGEKNRFRDSSLYYEHAATEASLLIQYYRQEAEKERRAKEDALRVLKNIPKEVIDSFLANRYRNVPKSNIDLAVDKNVGNEIVLELVEKDYLTKELNLSLQENIVLDSQVTFLQSSLMFSKSALLQADSAITIKTQQLNLSLQSNDLLQKDLKASRRKAFWNRWKGVGIGVAIGVAGGLLAQ